MSNNDWFKLRVTVGAGDHVVRGVLCEVRVPERATGPVEVRLFASDDHRLGSPFEFAINANIRASESRIGRAVRADHVFWKPGGGTTRWGPNLKEHVVVGEPMDLTITDTHASGRRRGRGERAHVTFWISPNVLLRPFKIRMPSYTGRVAVRARRPRRFTISGVSFTFDDYYRYRSQDDGSSVTFCEPVAAGYVRRLADVPNLLGPLEDFLLLAAVAARQRTICVGWDAVQSPKHVRHYRRGISIPAEKKDHGMNEVLIDPRHIGNFLRRAHRAFVAAPEQELLRQAMQRLVYEDGDRVNLANSFLRFYGAVEALVLRYRRMQGSEYVLTPPRWRRATESIRGAIRTAPGLTPPEAALLIAKVPELNRVTFGEGVRAFCDSYAVDCSDLWPLVSDGTGPSLSTIRNRLVHGDTIGDSEMSALMLAHEHLRWTAERFALSVLRWPISRSRVRLGVAATIETQDVGEARAFLAQRWRRQAQ